MINNLTQRDIILSVILVILIIGTFSLLYFGIDVPDYIVGTIMSILSGIAGIGIGNIDNGN